MTDETTVPTGSAIEDDALVEIDELIEIDVMEASMSCMGSVQTGELEAMACAIGSASVDGDAFVSASAAGLVTAGYAEVRQGLAGAVVSDGEAKVSQSFTPLISARRVDMAGSANCLTFADEASATRSWIGLVAARNVTVSDDSRVIIDWRGAIILGLFMLGGFGIVAAVVWLTGRRVIGALSRISARIPHLPSMPHLPDLSRMVSAVARLRRAA